MSTSQLQQTLAALRMSLAEMRRLEAFIAEHSRRAEQSITARWQERQGG